MVAVVVITPGRGSSSGVGSGSCSGHESGSGSGRDIDSGKGLESGSGRGRGWGGRGMERAHFDLASARTCRQFW